MSKQTERDLMRAWKDPEGDADYAVHLHFIEFASADRSAYDCAEEARRITSLVLDEEVEEGSPQASLLDALAMAAWECAEREIAKRLGIDHDEFIVFMESYETLTIAQLPAALEKARQQLMGKTR